MDYKKAFLITHILLCILSLIATISSNELEHLITTYWLLTQSLFIASLNNEEKAKKQDEQNTNKGRDFLYTKKDIIIISSATFAIGILFGMIIASIIVQVALH